MKSLLPFALTILIHLLGNSLWAQSQSQAGVNLSRASFAWVSVRSIPAWGGGAFYHYQWKGKNRAHSPLGLMAGIDYLRVNHQLTGVGPFIGFPPKYLDLQFSTLSFKTGLVANANASRGQRLQVYFHFGYLLLYEFGSSGKLVYPNRPPEVLEGFSYYGDSPKAFHNIYGGLDLRYQLGSKYFMGLYAQLSTVQLGLNNYGEHILFSGQLSFGRFIREEDEHPKWRDQPRQLSF